MFHLKSGDLVPVYALQLADAGGSAIDITSATEVRIRWTTPSGAAVTKDLAIANATEGRVQYQWEAGDTDEVGRYTAEVLITWPDGPQTLPSQGTFSFFIHPAGGITWVDVVGMAAELSTVEDETQLTILAHVNTALDPDYFGGEGHPTLRLARIFLAAHVATNAKNGSSGAAGPVISRTLGPSSVTYGWSGASSLTGFKELDSTPYGKQLRTLMRASPFRGPFVA